MAFAFSLLPGEWGRAQAERVEGKPEEQGSVGVDKKREDPGPTQEKLMHLALEAFNERRWQVAADQLAGAIELPSSEWLRVGLRQRRRYCLQRLGRNEAAARELSLALEELPRAFVMGRFALPFTITDAQADLKALEGLAEAKDEERRFLSRALRALLLAHAGDHRRANRLVGAIRRKPGKHREALSVLVAARVAIVQDNPAGAARDLAAVVDEASADLRPQIYYWQGVALERTGARDDACFAFLKAALLYDQQWLPASNALARAASLAQASGRTEDAAALAKELARKYPFISRTGETKGEPAGDGS